MGVLERFRLDGRWSVITGGSRGLGRVMAGALAEVGSNLVLIGRDPETLNLAREELFLHGTHVEIIVGDMGKPEDIPGLCETVFDRAGNVDVLINNVGGRRVDIASEDLPLSEWQRLLDLNLTSAFLCTQHIARNMLSRNKGSIINIASIAGAVAIKGIRGRTYETAKAGLVGLTRSLAADWAPHGVRVNAIAPGGFLTEPNRKWYREKPELEATFRGMIPMGRLGEPEELGPLAVYLASDASSYMTGAILTIDGGYTLW